MAYFSVLLSELSCGRKKEFSADASSKFLLYKAIKRSKELKGRGLELDSVGDIQEVPLGKWLKIDSVLLIPRPQTQGR